MNSGPDSTLRCEICPRGCLLREDRYGVCGARTLTLESGRPVNRHRDPEHYSALALDPIEKKPLARFRPGSLILSVGGLGCNLSCPWCQNDDIAHPDGHDRLLWPHARHLSAEALVRQAVDTRRQGNIGICFTYNEPLLNVEQIEQVFRLAHAEGLATALVTNGCFNESTIRRIAPLTDAWNIDLKSFRDERYREIGGRLETVKAAIRTAHEHSHVEVTTLIVPGWNDSPEEMEEEARWLASVSPSIPLHISRFFPHAAYSGREATEPDTIFAAGKIAEAHLEHVYYGNI